MIGTCPFCGNWQWDKEVIGSKVRCPKCGGTWPFRKLPVYILTGCSGVGKTTTGQALQKMTDEYLVLDSDMFHSLLQPTTDEGHMQVVEQTLSLSKNTNQSGKLTIWTKAGLIDKLPLAYHARFFSRIKVLALTAEEDELRRRMTEGRCIADPEWIRSSVEYNAYFRSHTSIGSVAYDTLDITRLSPEEAAAHVLRWLQSDR